MTVQEMLAKKRREIQQIAARHGAFNVRVFGSVVRGEATPESDIDLLVDAGPRTSSWFPAGLMLELEDLLGHRVDIITESGLSPHLRNRVLEEADPL